MTKGCLMYMKHTVVFITCTYEMKRGLLKLRTVATPITTDS